MNMNSLDLVILITFTINLLIATFLMARKYFSNQNQIPPDLKRLLYRLFTVQTSVTFGIHIQMPYKYQLYLENGLTHSTISKIMCYHHLITGVWNIFLPFAIKYFGHRLLIVFASLCFSISSFIIGHNNGSINSFIVASCFSGLTMPTIMRCFQDIWQLEEKNLPSNWKANYVYNETRSFISLVTTWIISPLSSFIASHYGTRMIFNFTSILILVSILPTFILIKNPTPLLDDTNTNNNNEKSKETDISLVVKHFKEHKITFFVIFLDILISIGMFLFHQRSSAFLLTPEHKPPMGFVSGTNGVLDLTGAQIISLFSHFLPYQSWMSVFSFLMGTSMIFIFLSYKNKVLVFVFICMHSFVSSGFMANGFFLHKQYYPSDLRNYFMSLIRIPTSVTSFLIMWFWRSENIEYYALVAGFLLMISAVLFVFLKSKDDIESYTKDDGKLLLDVESSENDDKESGINIDMMEEEHENDSVVIIKQDEDEDDENNNDDSDDMKMNINRN